MKTPLCDQEKFGMFPTEGHHGSQRSGVRLQTHAPTVAKKSARKRAMERHARKFSGTEDDRKADETANAAPEGESDIGNYESGLEES